MLLIGLPGLELGAAERAWLGDPAVSGVILFARNFRDGAQLGALVAAIRGAAGRPLLLAVDQEGGPVQRLRGEGFTDLPPLAAIGALHREDPERARLAARLHARVMATELRRAGLDLSLAPVADLARGNRAIGERAFAADPEVCAGLVAAYVAGMAEAGMAATLKHFPGHGSIAEDSHDETACDPRPLAAFREEDWRPFRAGIAAGAAAVMMAHLVCPALGDGRPAGASPPVVARLREELGFAGIVMSDDLAMAGNAMLGALPARVAAHREAGCELILVCRPEQVPEALRAAARLPPVEPERLARLSATSASARGEAELREDRAMLAALLDTRRRP